MKNKNRNKQQEQQIANNNMIQILYNKRSATVSVMTGTTPEPVILRWGAGEGNQVAVGSGGVEPGTGEWVEDRPDLRIDLGTLSADNFVRWACSIIIITLNINGLNVPNKRQKLSEWLKKISTHMTYIRNLL